MSPASRIVALLLLLAAALPAFGQGVPATETQRIEQLIRSVEQLSDARFIRNGSAHDAAAAGQHLRRKWREAGSRVKTAQQFIELCASRSSVTGRPYEIRFANGSTQTSESFLRARLKELEARGA